MAHYYQLREGQALTVKQRLSGISLIVGMCLTAISGGLGGTVTGSLIQKSVLASSTPDRPLLSGTHISVSRKTQVNPVLPIASFATQIGSQQIALLQQQQAEAQAKALAEAETKRLTYSVPEQFQGTIVQSAQLQVARDAVALTFDDGPWDTTTDQILAILQQEGVKATFFWVGQAAQSQPEVARRVVNAGHAIGNHTWHHRYESMDAAQAASEIETAAKIFHEIAGIQTTLFRPPGGYLNNGLADYALSQGQTVVMWSVSSSDTDYTSDAATYAKNVLSAVKPGAIILLHDGGGDRSKTVAALPAIIRGLKAQGYRMVTVSELLKLQADGW